MDFSWPHLEDKWGCTSPSWKLWLFSLRKNMRWFQSNSHHSSDSRCQVIGHDSAIKIRIGSLNPRKMVVKSPVFCWKNGYWSKPWHLVNPKITGKWMFIPLELIVIGFGPPPNRAILIGEQSSLHPPSIHQPTARPCQALSASRGPSSHFS